MEAICGPLTKFPKVGRLRIAIYLCMASIRAHFDGKVFVPDEPVNIPANTPVRLVLASDKGPCPLEDLANLANSMPPAPDWPADTAQQLDHYLYGQAKRSA